MRRTSRHCRCSSTIARQYCCASVAILYCTMGSVAYAAHARFNLLLNDGYVIDVKNKLSGKWDIGIEDGKIAAVHRQIPARDAVQVIDVSGMYVSPGFVDIHAHVYSGTGRPHVLCGDLSVYPDGHTLRSGVTTVVDAGSSGWRNFDDFDERVIQRARTRVLAFINIVGSGMGGERDVEQNMDDMDPVRTSQAVLRHKDVIVGIKTAHFNGPSWTAVERALEAGELAHVPAMIDFGTFRPERPFQVLVSQKLRAGDIVTHAFIGAIPMFDRQGRVAPYLFQAQKRGVYFDVGHGCASFSFRQVIPAVQQGFWPDSISTDLHTSSMNGGMKDMGNLMSKFLSMGMPLEAVVARTTWNPAREIGHPELGHLSLGAPADIAVFRVETGHYGFVDTDDLRFEGTKRLVNELTLRAGDVVWDLNGISALPWAPNTPVAPPIHHTALK